MYAHANDTTTCSDNPKTKMQFAKAHCEERIFPVAHEGTQLEKAASFFIIEVVILQVEVDGCAGSWP